MLKLIKIDTLVQKVQALLRLVFHDIREIRAVLPLEMNREMFSLRVLMLAVATFETLTIYVIAFFSASIGSPEVIKSSFFFRSIFKTLPRFALWCTDDRKFLFFYVPDHHFLFDGHGSDTQTSFFVLP